VPIVPGAILFDLLSGGDKTWRRYPPYRELGYNAAVSAGVYFALGSVGAGLGATSVNLKGGVGSASATTSAGGVVGALAVVNPAGSAVVGEGPSFWAAPFEQDGEFGSRGFPESMAPEALTPRTKADLRASTVIAVIGTDVALTKAQAKRLAVMAQTGLARAVYPVHTPLDGDVVFAVSAGERALSDPLRDFSELGAMAANTLARAVARGVYEATALPFPGALPSWKEKFGK
jgi:L-aminopeptidase/D-esterase-like protein